MKINTLATAYISVFLYTILIVASTGLFMHQRRLKSFGIGGRYVDAKIRFFGLLMISAILDSPTWVACVALGGPFECEWETLSYPICWICHLGAVCGYAVCLTIPPVLWDDIIKRRDGSMLFSEVPKDVTRVVFCAILIFYILIEILNVILILVYYRVHDHTYFYDGAKGGWLRTIGLILEPFAIVLLAGYCLFCGIKLQWHVMRLGFQGEVQRRMLVQLNVVMAVVVLCYFARSVVLVTLYEPGNDFINHTIPLDFFDWTLFTRWLPHVVCSLCLMAVMGRSTNNATGVIGYGDADRFFRPYVPSAVEWSSTGGETYGGYDFSDSDDADADVRNPSTNRDSGYVHTTQSADSNNSASFMSLDETVRLLRSGDNLSRDTITSIPGTRAAKGTHSQAQSPMPSSHMPYNSHGPATHQYTANRTTSSNIWQAFHQLSTEPDNNTVVTPLNSTHGETFSM